MTLCIRFQCRPFPVAFSKAIPPTSLSRSPAMPRAHHRPCRPRPAASPLALQALLTAERH